MLKCLFGSLNSIVYNCLLYKQYFLAFLLLWIFWPLLFSRILNLQIFFCQNVLWVFFFKGLQRDFSCKNNQLHWHLIFLLWSQSKTSKYLIIKENKKNSSKQFIDSSIQNSLKTYDELLTKWTSPVFFCSCFVF